MFSSTVSKEYWKNQMLTRNSNRFLMKAKKEEVFLKAFEMSHDRAYGKADQHVDLTSRELSAVPNDILERIAQESSENGAAVEGGK